jgi:HEAT repeat protein
MPPIGKRSGKSGAAPTERDPAALLDLLGSGTEEERWSAARAAAQLPGGVTALGEALRRETVPRVREAIFTALARIATPQSVETVLPLLRSHDARIRTEASDALLAMKSAAWPFLSALLRDQDAAVRILACDLVRNMPNDLAVRLFCDLLDSEPEPNVCAAAVDVLAEIGGPEALAALTRCEARFRTTPFVAFSIRTVIDRIRSQSAEPRG